MSALLPLLLAAACGLEPSSFTGEVVGKSLNSPVTAMWGGPYLFFSNVELDCKEVDWVHFAYSVGEAPTDKDLIALQFSFLGDDDMFEGTFSVEGEAPVNARFLDIDDGAFAEYRARTGILVVDELTEQGPASGTFDLGFDDGAISGTWSAEWCVNLPE